MTNQELSSISIRLSPTQVDEVVRAATRSPTPSLSSLIASSLRAPLSGAGQHAEGDGERGNVRPERREQMDADTAGARPARGAHFPGDTDDPRLSRSLLRGLSLLTGFGPDASERGIVELATDLGMSASTAHRYAVTLVELGLLERCPNSRKYRLPQSWTAADPRAA